MVCLPVWKITYSIKPSSFRYSGLSPRTGGQKHGITTTLEFDFMI